MGIDHNMMLGCLGDCILVMVHHPLAVMVVSRSDHITHVTALDSVITVFLHQAVGLLQMTLIVSD